MSFTLSWLVVVLALQCAAGQFAGKLVPVPLGIRMPDGSMATIVPRGTMLPTRQAKTFTNHGIVEIIVKDYPVSGSLYRFGHLDVTSTVLSGEPMRVEFVIKSCGLLVVSVSDEGTRLSSTGRFYNYRHVHRALSPSSSLYSETHGALALLAQQLQAVRTLFRDSSSVMALQQQGSSALFSRASIDLLSARCDEFWGRSPSDVPFVRQSYSGPASTAGCPQTPSKGPQLDSAGTSAWHSATSNPRDPHDSKNLAPPSSLFTALAVVLLMMCVSVTRQDTVSSACASSCQVKHDMIDVRRLEGQLQATRALVAKREVELEQLRSKTAGVPPTTDNPAEIYAYELEERTPEGMARFIRIQCPGVTSAEIEIELIPNGAVITIDRKESDGVQRLAWSGRFQFPLEEGLFEFREEEAQLEYGILKLAFRSEPPARRVFRFSQASMRDSPTACEAYWVNSHAGVHPACTASTALAPKPEPFAKQEVRESSSGWVNLSRLPTESSEEGPHTGTESKHSSQRAQP